MTDAAQTTRELIIARRCSIEAEAEPLRSRLAAFESELRQIDAALSAMDGVADFSTDPSRDTIQQGVLRALSAAPTGLHANDILRALRVRRPSLTRVSLAPQLSRLKRAGRVKRLADGVWALAHAPETA